jgi:hypothetical protein
LAAGVVDTGGKLPPVSLTPAANDPNVIFRGLGEDDSWKKTLSKKSLLRIRDVYPGSEFFHP